LKERKNLKCAAKKVKGASYKSFFETGVFNNCWETCFKALSNEDQGRYVSGCSIRGYWKWMDDDWWPSTIERS